MKLQLSRNSSEHNGNKCRQTSYAPTCICMTYKKSRFGIGKRVRENFFSTTVGQLHYVQLIFWYRIVEDNAHCKNRALNACMQWEWVYWHIYSHKYLSIHGDRERYDIESAAMGTDCFFSVLVCEFMVEWVKKMSIELNYEPFLLLTLSISLLHNWPHGVVMAF